MSDLRQGAIEAAAEALRYPAKGHTTYEEMLEPALDALLDYLEANADEWIETERQATIQRMVRAEGYHRDVATIKPIASTYEVFGLIAALRGEGTEKGTE